MAQIDTRSALSPDNLALLMAVAQCGSMAGRRGKWAWCPAR